MKSQILTKEHPLSVSIYEEPEFSDSLPWIVIIFAFFILFAISSLITDRTFAIETLLIVVVITIPFFVNRFILKRNSMGGESFKIERFANNIIVYRNNEMKIQDLKFECITRRMNFGTLVMLYMLYHDKEIKLRSDHSDNQQISITYNLAITINDHLKIDIDFVQE